MELLKRVDERVKWLVRDRFLCPFYCVEMSWRGSSFRWDEFKVGMNVFLRAIIVIAFSPLITPIMANNFEICFQLVSNCMHYGECFSNFDIRYSLWRVFVIFQNLFGNLFIFLIIFYCRPIKFEYQWAKYIFISHETWYSRWKAPFQFEF